ncbi:MAG: flagellar hook-associated protein FlgK [Deltaproteobacteria bacterium]|nr:flagellar hook-associated protein FlgK [Deltaproteobacteria bacterium]
MPGIYSVMDISKTSLYTNAQQLNVVSHNVANINTEGYSRQTGVQATRTPVKATEGMFGTGASLTSVIQTVDRFLESRLTDKYTDVAYYGDRLDQLRRLEAIANEAGETGLGMEMTRFFNAWQDLSNNPESSAVREVLLETAENLADRFSTLQNDMFEMQRDMTTYLKEGVDKVNALSQQIADLNQKIMANETVGKPANDYRDERQRKINELAGMINIQWFEQGDGQVTVVAGEGKTLVQADYPKSDDLGPLEFHEVDDPNFQGNQIVWVGTDVVMTPEEITGGELGAWLSLRDQDIPEMQAFVDDLAKTLIGQVNLVHSEGVGLDLLTSVTGTYKVSDPTAVLGNEGTLEYGDLLSSGDFKIWVYEAGTRRDYTISPAPLGSFGQLSLENVVDRINSALHDPADPNNPNNPTAKIVDNQLVITGTLGTEFAFSEDDSGLLAALGVNTFFDGFSAHNISVRDEVTSDPNLVNAGRLLADGEHAKGDNSLALDLADLKDAATMQGGTMTFNEAVTTFASELGAKVSHNQSMLDFAELTQGELLDLRDNMSGVNLDEEMVKMIQFQRAYQMSAKLIKMADELLTTLIGLV